MEEWIKVKLADCCESISDGDHMPPPKVAAGVPFITISNIKGNQVDLSGTFYVTQDYYDSLDEKRRPRKGDILYTVVGTFGIPVLLRDDTRFVFQRHIAILRPNNKIDSRFLYYLLLSPTFYRIADQLAIGAVQRTIGLKALREQEIIIPASIIEQRRIADILSSIDEKIILNNRINHNLLTIAQSLFDERIADNPTMNSAFKKGVLTDIASFLNGIAMQKYPISDAEAGLPVLKIKELGQGSCDENSDRCTSTIPEQYIIVDGDIIFSWSGTLLVDYWCGGTCGLNQHLFKVSSTSFPGWFIYFWTKYHLDRFKRIAQDKAVTMGHIRRTDLEQAEVLIPQTPLLRTFDKEISPLMEEYVQRRIENRRLQSMRDNLLPQIMSGSFYLTC